MVLTDGDGRVLLDRVLAARRPVADHDAASLARAVGAALDDAVRQVADRVEEALPTAPGATLAGPSGAPPAASDRPGTVSGRTGS